MGQILILGNKSVERSGLALFMEFVGHNCTEVDSVAEAAKLLGKNNYDLVLADAVVSDTDTDKMVRTLQAAAPKANVMILAEDGASAVTIDDVITSPLTAFQSVSPQYPPVRKGEAFLVLLPETDSLKMLPDLPQSSGLLNKLALIYQSQQKYTAAEQLYKRAIELNEKASGDSSREGASILMNLASLYHEQKKYAEAERLYERSLKLAEKAHGISHPKVARRLRRLAEIYRVQGKEKEAAPVHERLRKMA